MNKRILSLIFCASVVLGAHIAKADFASATASYDEGKYVEARAGFEALVKSKQWSANVFYNLGNTYYRLNQFGESALAYERALALEPTHRDAARNLEFVRKQSGARTESREWQERIALPLTASQAVIVFSVFGWCTLAAVLWLATSKRRSTPGQKVAVAVAFLLCIYIGSVAWIRASEASFAVVIAKNAEARQAPADRAPLAEALPTGSRVKILSERGPWVYCALPGKSNGWLPAQAIERVAL